MDANQTTLDETVAATITRDLTTIWANLLIVLNPFVKGQVLSDWDWWGPFLMFLVLAIRLSSATLDQASVMFSTTLVVLFVGSAAVTLNAVLLGAKVNIFQTVCVLGYCVFPLLCASFVGLVVPFFLRVVAVTVAYAWTLVASTTFLGELNLARKRPLALYPIALFYLLVAWLVLVTP